MWLPCLNRYFCQILWSQILLSEKNFDRYFCQIDSLTDTFVRYFDRYLCQILWQILLSGRYFDRYFCQIDTLTDTFVRYFDRYFCQILWQILLSDRFFDYRSHAQIHYKLHVSPRFFTCKFWNDQREYREGLYLIFVPIELSKYLPNNKS